MQLSKAYHASQLAPCEIYSSYRSQTCCDSINTTDKQLFCIVQVEGWGDSTSIYLGKN